MKLKISGRRIAVGCALGSDGLYVAVPERRGAASLQLIVPWGAPATSWEERLVPAMQEIVTRCGTSHLALQIALLPPLVRHRFVSLPAMAVEDVRRVLRRDAGRYFCGAREAQEVAVARGGKGAPLSVAAVDAALMDALERSITSAGAHLGAVFSAYDIWNRIAGRELPAASGAALSVVVLGDARYDRLRTERKQLVALRYGPARLFDGIADVTIADDESWRLRTALHAARARGAVPFVLERLRAAAVHMAWRNVRWLGMAAAVLLVLAGALDLWGLQRERDLLRAVRRAEQAATSGALALREAAALRARHLEALTTARATAPRWTPVLARLAETLPADAYLTGLRAAADSVVIEGVAGSSAGVFNALHEMPGVSQVRALAPIRHERTDGEATIERFVIGLELIPSAGESRP